MTLYYYLLIWFSTLKLWAALIFILHRGLPAGKSIAKILTKHYTLLIKIQHCYLYLPWWRCVLYGGAHYTLLKTFFIRRAHYRPENTVYIYVYILIYYNFIQLSLVILNVVCWVRVEGRNQNIKWSVYCQYGYRYRYPYWQYTDHFIFRFLN